MLGSQIELKLACYLNPHIFGRGQWNDIKKLRYELQVDFDSLEAKSSSTRVATYSEAKDLLENGNVKEVDRVVTKDKESNTTDTKIIVDNKVNNSSNSKLNEINLLKEHNRKKELEIKIKELKNEEIKLNIEELHIKIEAKKIGIDI